MDLRVVHTVLLGPVALRKRGEHLLRGLGGREVLREVGGILLHPVGPRRAAAREQRQRAALGEALDELSAFLHDRDVGGEVRVEHLVEAEHAQRRVDLARGELARLQAERLANGDAHGRGDLHEAGLLRIAQRGPDLRGLVVLVDSAHGAVRGALAALDAGRLHERHAGGGLHHGLLAAADELERPHVLHLLAHLGAAAALDALVGIENDRRRGPVGLVVDDLLRERIVADAEVGRDVLQLAAARARALEAVVRVVGEDELEHCAANLHDVGIVRKDLHAGRDLCAAGAQQLGAGHELAGLRAARNELADDADAAARAGLEVRMVAERGDLDVSRARRVEDRSALRHLHGLAVDLKGDHFGFHRCKFLSFLLNRG